ncbi:hypothetical protein ES703_25831 [subsurface metagenome]
MAKIITVVVAIAAIVYLEALALSKGINGAYLSLAFIAIAGLAGYEIKNVVSWFKSKKK